MSADEAPAPGQRGNEPDGLIHWDEAGQARQARWRSERAAAPPRKVLLADDTMPADTAYRLACEGTGLLWRGDFQNARHLLQALARRIHRTPARKRRKSSQVEQSDPATAFHLHRQAQAQRARVLGAILIEFEPDFGIALRRAPDARMACLQAWGDANAAPSVASLRELLGLIGAHEWRARGVEIAALGTAPNNRIHPHYGVFSPVRGEYVDLVASAPWPLTDPARQTVVDIGTGTGVLAAVLARRGAQRIVATELDPRALTCAADNLARLGLSGSVQLLRTDLFPPGEATLIVCNPPWLPARPSAPVERAVYDEGGRMLTGFLDGLARHLAPGGEGWLILSDLAEHLGLRTRDELLAVIDRAGLVVLGRLDARPHHRKATDPTDPLYRARAAELTSLWRLGARPSP